MMKSLVLKIARSEYQKLASVTDPSSQKATLSTYLFDSEITAEERALLEEVRLELGTEVAVPDRPCEKCKNKENIIRQLEADIKRIQNDKMFQYKQLSMVETRISQDRDRFEAEIKRQEDEHCKQLEEMQNEHEVAVNTVTELLARTDRLSQLNAQLLREKNAILSKLMHISEQPSPEHDSLEWVCRTQTKAIEQLLQIKNGAELQVRCKDQAIDKLLTQKADARRHSSEPRDRNKENVAPGGAQRQHSKTGVTSPSAAKVPAVRLKRAPLSSFPQNALLSPHNTKISLAMAPSFRPTRVFRRTLSAASRVMIVPTVGLAPREDEEKRRKSSVIRAMLRSNFSNVVVD